MSKPLRVLIVEDNDNDRLLLLRTLRQGGYEPVHRCVQTAADLSEALAEEQWDIVLSDYRLPQFDGPAALELTKESGLNLPFIIVSGVIGEEQAAAIMKAGAHDYVLKNKLTRLIPAIARELDDAEARRQRQLSEVALRASEARFQQMANTIEDVLYALDGTTGEFLYISSAFDRLLGYTLADVTRMGGRKAFLTHVIEDGNFSDMQLNFQALPGRWEAWWRCKDGSRRCIEDRCIPDYADEHLVSIYGVLRDITARKQAEQALQQERANLQTIFNAVSVGMLLLDETGGIRRTNTVIDGWTGKKPSAMLSAQPGSGLGCIHADQEGRPCGSTTQCPKCPIRRAFTSVLKSGQPVHDVDAVMVLLVGGKTVQLSLEINADPVVMDGQRHVILTLNDITARKLAETRLRLLSAGLEATASGVVITDEHGTIQWVNPAFTRLTGYSSAEAVGQNPRLLKSGQQPKTFYKKLWGNILRGEPWHGQMVNRHKNGTFYHDEMTITPVRATGDEITNFIAVMENITARKQTEEAIAQLNAELESRVVQRTAELQGANKLLHQAVRGWRALSECNETLLRTTSEVELLEQVCRIIVNYGGYRMAWAGLADDDDATKTVRPVAEAGFGKGYLKKINITWADKPRGCGPTGTAIRTRQANVCRNILTDPRLVPWRKEAVARGYASSVALPLLAEGRCLGALTVYAVEPDAFTQDEVKLLTDLVNDLAYGMMALRTRAARTRLEQQVLEISNREQRRIGQDLHDDLGQWLVGIAFKIEALKNQLTIAGRPEAGDADQIGVNIHEALQQTRALARGLHPVKPEAEGLMSALMDLADTMVRNFKVRCQFDCHQPVLVKDNEVATNLYRIAQESARNAGMHGHPKNIWISLQERGGQINLIIKDDGRGLPKTKASKLGLGLEIMKYRASTIGATLSVSSQKGKGTIVSCSLVANRGQRQDNKHAH